MPKLKYWLWLSSAKLWSRSKARIIEYYGDPEAAFLAPEGDFANVPGLTRAEIAELEKRDVSACERIASDCARQGIEIITFSDPRYPARLKNAYSAPPVLFVKGILPLIDENPVISVVGTRKCSPYGEKMARIMAYGIAKCGGTVITLLGGAIDTAVYKGAQMAGGSCIAVIPYSHEQADEKKLAEIYANGAVISEYAPGTETMKAFFRDRNRLAAALSVGLVVVEAPAKSGTKLFADEAAELGREIFAVPGNADAENSVGTLALIKEGAKLVTSGAEVMSEFEALFPNKIKLRGQLAVPELPEGEEDKPKPQKSSGSQGRRELEKQLEGLSEEQLEIVMAIDNNSSHIDDIIENTGIAAAKVLAQLTILELKGIVRRESGRRISLNTAKK